MTDSSPNAERMPPMPRIPEQFKCDHPGCESVRTETNHWWMVDYQEEFRVSAWNDAWTRLSTIQFYCGQEHLLAALSRWAGEVGGEK